MKDHLHNASLMWCIFKGDRFLLLHKSQHCDFVPHSTGSCGGALWKPWTALPLVEAKHLAVEMSVADNDIE